MRVQEVCGRHLNMHLPSPPCIIQLCDRTAPTLGFGRGVHDTMTPVELSNVVQEAANKMSVISKPGIPVSVSQSATLIQALKMSVIEATTWVSTTKSL